MKKILVIDDDPPILKGIEMVLKNVGYETQTTLNGAEAIPLINSFKPDLVLLDVMLGEMDGRDIAQKIKHLENTEHIPIIIISANQNMAKGIESYGVDTFIAKPFSSGQLIKTIEKYCGKP